MEFLRQLLMIIFTPGAVIFAMTYLLKRFLENSFTRELEKFSSLEFSISELKI